MYGFVGDLSLVKNVCCVYYSVLIYMSPVFTFSSIQTSKLWLYFLPHRASDCTSRFRWDVQEESGDFDVLWGNCSSLANSQQLWWAKKKLLRKYKSIC